jgi:hypothetical protein
MAGGGAATRKKKLLRKAAIDDTVFVELRQNFDAFRLTGEKASENSKSSMQKPRRPMEIRGVTLEDWNCKVSARPFPALTSVPA